MGRMAEKRQDQKTTVAFSITENSPSGHVSFQVPTTRFLGQSQNPPCAPKTQPLTLTHQGLQTVETALPVMPVGNLGVQPGMALLEPVSAMLRGLELRWTSPLQASCPKVPALAVLPASEPEACTPCSPPRGQGVGGREVSWLAHPCHTSCGPRTALSQQGAKEPRSPETHAYHPPYTATRRRRPQRPGKPSKEMLPLPQSKSSCHPRASLTGWLLSSGVSHLAS